MLNVLDGTKRVKGVLRISRVAPDGVPAIATADCGDREL